MWKLTRKAIEAHRPCEDDYAAGLAHFPRRRVVSFAEVAVIEEISTDDLIWLLRVCATDQQARLIACDVAEHCQPNPIPAANQRAIDTSRRYAFGLATKKGLRAARTGAAYATGVGAYPASAAAHAAERAWQRKLIIKVASDPDAYVEDWRKKITGGAQDEQPVNNH